MNKKIFNLIEDDSIWFMFSSEQSDEYFGKFISNITIAPAISIINNKECVVFVHELDSENIKDNDIKKITYYTNKDLYENIEKVIKEMEFPKNVHLNYSTQNDVKIDVLGYGTYKYVTNLLSLIYKENNKECIFESAENYIYALMQQNSKEEIQASTYAARKSIRNTRRSI